ncbi:MAG: sulfate transporter CysZ [Gammaproteobacteria bacterium]
MFEEFSHGAGCLFRGFGFLLRPGIKRHVIVPLLINVVLFGCALAYAANHFDTWLQHLTAGLPAWLSWLASLLWLLFAFAALVVLFYTFTLVANLIGAPFNSFLSARVQALVTGERPDSGRGLAGDIVISLRDELRRILYILWRAILIGLLGLLLFFIPLFSILTPLLWLLFTAWMLAMQYSDYPLSNHGVDFTAQRPLLKQQRNRLFGFGIATALCTLIPVMNFIIMPAAVAGATLLWIEADLPTVRAFGAPSR